MQKTRPVVIKECTYQDKEKRVNGIGKVGEQKRAREATDDHLRRVSGVSSRLHPNASRKASTAATLGGLLSDFEFLAAYSRNMYRS